MLGCAAAVLGSACDSPTGLLGTGTLLAVAEINVINVGGGFQTGFVVALLDLEEDAVSDAVVTFTHDELGTVELQEQPSGSGIYVGGLDTYLAGDYRLEVTRGEDNLQRVIRGLEIHAIERPEPGEEVQAGEPLEVRWTNPSSSARVRLETRDYQINDVSDSGSYTIAAEDNPVRQNQRVRIWRSTGVNITGGLPGSRLNMTIRNSVEQYRVRN
jgi:hypothetical protein